MRSLVILPNFKETPISKVNPLFHPTLRRKAGEMTAIEAFGFKRHIGIVSHVHVATTLVKPDVMRFQSFVDIAKSFHEKPPEW